VASNYTYLFYQGFYFLKYVKWLDWVAAVFANQDFAVFWDVNHIAAFWAVIGFHYNAVFFEKPVREAKSAITSEIFSVWGFFFSWLLGKASFDFGEAGPLNTSSAQS
jgi:hypothetical protein